MRMLKRGQTRMICQNPNAQTDFQTVKNLFIRNGNFAVFLRKRLGGGDSNRFLPDHKRARNRNQDRTQPRRDLWKAPTSRAGINDDFLSRRDHDEQPPPKPSKRSLSKRQLPSIAEMRKKRKYNFRSEIR